MRHGYRSRKELNVEHAKKVREAEAKEPMPRISMFEEYPDELSHFNWDNDFTVDFLLNRSGSKVEGAFKTSHPRSGMSMFYTTPPCRPFFDPEAVRRAAMGGKSETAMAIMRRDVSLAARDLERDAVRRNFYRERMIEGIFNPMLHKFAGKRVKFDPVWLNTPLCIGDTSDNHEVKSADEILADLMKTIAGLSPMQPVAKKFDPFDIQPYQRQTLDYIQHEFNTNKFWRQDFAIRGSAFVGESIFRTPYGRPWYKLNRLTHQLHALHGDNRPHKINVAPEGIA